MGRRTINSPFGTPTLLMRELLGNTYPTIEYVSEHLPEIIELVSLLQNLRVVDTIADRDALQNVGTIQVHVKDASADLTVGSGGATYLHDPETQTWIKISEAESLDRLFPDSTPEEIDAAVTNVADLAILVANLQADIEAIQEGQIGYSTVFVWRRLPYQPETPTGNGVPLNWSASPPAGTSALWFSTAKQNADGELITGSTWSVPVRASGENGAAGAQGPQGPQGPAGAPGADGAPGPIGPQGPAGAAGTAGTPGQDGTSGDDGSHIEFVWRRDPGQPSAPIGPGIPSGWYDEPMDGEYPLWMSRSKQRPDGTLVTPWSNPIRHDGAEGAQGIPGPVGPDGLPSYMWVAYADSPDGALNFTTGTPGERAYIGIAYNKTDPVESVDPGDYTWAQYKGPSSFGLVTDANSAVSGNKISKTGASGAWDSQVFSSEGFTSGCYLSFRIDTPYESVIGLNTDATASSWNTIDYHIYFDGNGNADARTQGGVLLGSTTYTADDVFALHYDNHEIHFLKNGVSFHDEDVASGLTFYLDTALKYQGPNMAIISFVPAGSKGQDGIDGSNGVDGEAAISAWLTNESVTLWAYANGNVRSYDAATGDFKVFHGEVDVSANFELTTGFNPQGLLVDYFNQTYTVAGGLDLNEDIASLSIRATGSGLYVGVIIEKTFTITKATGGYEIVDVLPLDDLFDGRIVYLSSDGKLYRYVGVPGAGGEWTARIPTADVAGLDEILVDVGDSITVLEARSDASQISLAQAQTAQDKLAAAVVRLGTEASRTRETMRDAGITVDPQTGVVRLFSADQTAERLSEVDIRLDSAEAQIQLKASTTYVDNAIAVAVLNPSEVPIFEGLDARLTTVEVGLDAVEGEVALKAETIALNAVEARVTTAETDINSLEGAISDKVDTTTFNALDTRVASAESTLSAIDDLADITDVVRSSRLLTEKQDQDAQNTLSALLTGDRAKRATVQAVAEARRELRTDITDGLSAEATARLELTSRMGAAEAALISESQTRANQDSALSSQITSISADLATEATNRTAAINSEASARVSADNALSTRADSLEATTGSHTATLSSHAGAITTLQGENQAYWQVEGNAGSGSTFFISARARANYGDAPTSNISFGAREFHIWNPSGASWVKTVEVVAGVVRIHGQLDVGSVTTDQLAAGAVTAAKINVTSLSAISGNLGSIEVGSANIANGAVTNAKIGDGQITTAKIGDAQITSAKIGDLEVNNAKIANLTLGGEKLQANSVTKVTSFTHNYGQADIPVKNEWTNINMGGVTAQISISTGDFTGQAIIINATVSHRRKGSSPDTFSVRIIRNDNVVLPEVYTDVETSIVDNTFVTPFLFTDPSPPQNNTPSYRIQINSNDNTNIGWVTVQALLGKR